MVTENIDKLSTVFKLRSIRRVGAEMLKGSEKEAFKTIHTGFEKERLKADQFYRAEYKTRVEVERRRLIDEAGSHKKEFKPSYGMFDRFNNNDLKRQSQLNVRSDHIRTMDRLDKQELKESEGFLQKSSQRKKYLSDFKQTSERRRAETRRQSPERRRSPSQTMSD